MSRFVSFQLANNLSCDFQLNSNEFFVRLDLSFWSETLQVTHQSVRNMTVVSDSEPRSHFHLCSSAVPHWLWPFPGQLQAETGDQQGACAFHLDLRLCPRDPTREDEQQREVWEVQYFVFLFIDLWSMYFMWWLIVASMLSGSGSTVSGPIRSCVGTGRCSSTSLLQWRQQDCQSSPPSKTSSI